MVQTASPDLKPFLAELEKASGYSSEQLADLRRRADRSLSPMDRFQFHSALSDMAEGAQSGHVFCAGLDRKVTHTPLYKAGDAVQQGGDVFPDNPGYDDSAARHVGERSGTVAGVVGLRVVPGGGQELVEGARNS